MFKFMRKKDNCLLFIICSIGLTLAAMPFITNLLYQADDYVLLGTYDINLSTLGYNYRAYGRYMEGLLAEILYRMNLSPLTKPMGIYCFISFNVMLGIYIVEKLDIKDLTLRGALVLAIVSNPFLVEIYCYSTIPVFSGFAMLFLVMGAEAGERIKANKNGGGYLGLSIACYIISLSIYQIYYVIMVSFFIFKIVILFCKNIKFKECKNDIIQLCICLFSLGIYYLIVSFTGVTKNSSIGIGKMLKSLFSEGYWGTVGYHLKRSFFSDNVYNSALISNIFLMTSIVCIGLVIIYAVKNREYKKALVRCVVYILYSVIGIIECFGFSLAYITTFSGRCATAYGFVIVSLGVLFGYELLGEYFSIDKLRKVSITLCLIIGLSNLARTGRCAIDLQRLNNLESNLANRIVARMEGFAGFSNNVKVYMSGTVQIGSLDKTRFYVYNRPALDSYAKIHMLNEVSGYKFQGANGEDIDIANELLSEMGVWPAENSCVFLEERNLFIIKMSE